MIGGRRGARCLLVLALVGLAGCHLFSAFNPVTPPRSASAARDPVPALPAKHSFRLSQYYFLTDLDLRRDQPLFQELVGLRDQVYRELQLPEGDNLIRVYIFENRERYEQFMHARYPALPKRRAFFVAQPHSVGGAEDLLVYTYWGDRAREDLRHELTHALLHSVLKDVPLWLDEGLAEYFEVPPASGGINRRHLDLMRHGPDGPCRSDLARLEQLSQVEQMAPAEYRESWAWVHLMLRGPGDGKAVLLGYLQQLRTNPNPGPLQPRLAAVFPAADAALDQHLARLEASTAGIDTEAQRPARPSADHIK